MTEIKKAAKRYNSTFHKTPMTDYVTKVMFFSDLSDNMKGELANLLCLLYHHKAAFESTVEPYKAAARRAFEHFAEFHLANIVAMEKSFIEITRIISADESIIRESQSNIDYLRNIQYLLRNGDCIE